jgi:hypothetical protein
MIRPLRRLHLWLVAALTAIVAPLYLAALATRPAPAVQEVLPAGLTEPAAAVSGEGIELATTPPIRVRPAAGDMIEVGANGFVEGADLLLYWAPADGARSLADAHLLGALRGGERQLFALPDAAAGKPGVLVLYSLGHDEEMTSAPWPASPEAGP